MSTDEQQAAVAQLADCYAAQRADNLVAARLWPGEGDPEYEAADARYFARLEPDGELDAGWRRLYDAYGNAPPDDVVESILARFWGPAPIELDAFDPVVTPFDGRKATAA